MFKTHLVQNKQLVSAVSIVFGYGLLVLVNVILLGQVIISVYTPPTTKSRNEPIDTQTVTDAIQFIAP